MMNIPIEEIITKIKEKTNLGEEAIKKKIDEKFNSLSGMVSKNGAAHIVSNEFGVTLFKMSETGFVKIKNISPELKYASFVGRVISIFPPKEFKTEKREGKVCSMIIGDETGKTRLVLWDTNQIKLVEDKQISEGDIIRISNCYIKDGMYGTECHSRASSRLEVNPELSEKIPSLEDLKEHVIRTQISNISDAGSYEIRGAIVNLLENNIFFEVCPQCRKKVESNSCQIHGEVTPQKNMFVSSVVDDGTGNIRVVFFGKQAEEILGMSPEEAFALATENNNMSYPIMDKKSSLLGKEFIIDGRVSKNDFSGELEMIARKVTTPNPVIEADNIIKND